MWRGLRLKEESEGAISQNKTLINYKENKRNGLERLLTKIKRCLDKKHTGKAEALSGLTSSTYT